jgi:steroid delta-isomerase-like uncharacterized protein
MTAQETERIMSGYLDALLSGGDFGSFFAEDVVWTTMETGDQVRGRQDVTDFIVALHTQMFAASPELVNVVSGDGVAILEAVFAGTHSGEFAGIPPTNADVRLPYCVGYDVRDGQITALRAYFPVTQLHQQLSAAATASV